MTVKELITKLLDRPMDDEVMLCYDKIHTDEFGDVIQGYGFHIDSVRDSDIMFTDWRDKAEQEPKSEWEQDHEILKAYSDGANEVLDKIRAEIEQEFKNEFGPYGQGLRRAIEIIDKYKAESE